MKTSYIKFLRVVVDIAFYLMIVGAFMVMAMPVISAFYPKSAVQVSMPIPLQLKDNASFSGNGLAGTVSSSDYSELSIRLTDFEILHQNVLLYVTMLLTFTALASGLLLLVYQLRQLIRTIGTPAVFSSTNVVRIRIIGGLLIAAELVKPIMWLVIRPNVLALLNRSHIHYISEQVGVSTSGLVFAGLLIIGLAEVFRSGYQLKQEQELTI